MRTLIAFLPCLFLSFCLFAQVNYTANDQIIPYNGVYRAGVNPGYHGPNWSSQTLADISAGNPAAGTEGVGVRALRGSLPEDLALQYGYFIWTPLYDYFDGIGLKDNTVFVGFAADLHRDPVQYCPGIVTDMFDNLYEPIWDNGENGTPVNDDNYYALYLYNVIQAMGDHVKFWEIWNEPGFDFSGAHGWLEPGQPGNWWENPPDPCDYKLRAPVYHYIRTLRISYDVIKTLAPEDYVVVSGVGYDSFLDVILRYTDNPVDGSVTSQYPLTGGAYFDVLGFHAYPHIDGSLRYWDNSIGGFVYTRHSDAAIAGLLDRQQARRTILQQYGYDGNTYPEKLWTVTEVNVPRKAFNSESVGSDILQVNYISKLVAKSIENDIVQTHIWDLGEKEYFAEADSEFDLMGLYLKLNDEEPFTEQPTDEGISYKTASDFLFGCSFDASKTASMNLPSNVGGGAYQRPNGDHVYMLWAITQTDLSESAFANYSFPGSFGISNLTKQEWDFSQTGTQTTVDEQNVALTGTPIYLTPNINTPLGELTLVCPDYEFELGVTEQEGGAFVTWQEPFATTTCPSGGATVTLESSTPNGGFFPFGMNVVRYKAVDNCGNETSCSMAIKVASTGGGIGDCHLYRFNFNYRGSYNGNKYFISKFDTTWTAAKEICESHGGYLLSISDQAENDFVQDNMEEDVAFIGLTDYLVEGQLQWEDGSPVTYTNYDNCSWCGTNTAQNDYVEFHRWNGEWSFNDGSAEMFFLMELPCSTFNCLDDDNDGVCNADDCAINDPSLPTTPGTPCDDGDPNTDNDVIQADGCTCQGTGNNPCGFTWSVNGTTLTVNDAVAPHVKIRVFDAGWQIVFECFDDCNNPQTVTLPEGDYILDVLLMDANWQSLCVLQEPFTVDGSGCPDNDNDGVCAADDCDDNDPSVPTAPGTPCDDNNPTTNNDVIQSDGCTCAGTPTGDPDCSTVQISAGSNSITISGVIAPISIIQVFDPSWSTVFNCNNSCNATETVSNLPEGTYYVKVRFFTANWQSICEVTEYVEVSDGPCTDADNDGVCAPDDCDDNNPDLPALVGSSCDDGNPNTTNDVIQSDGCTCAGTPIGGGPCGLSYSTSNNSITFSFDNSPHYKIRLFDPSWQVVFECLDDCNNPQTVSNLAPGTYHIDVLLFDGNWATTCSHNEAVVISGGAGANMSGPGGGQPHAVQSKLETSPSVFLYPNPTGGVVYVRPEVGIGQAATFEVRNALGVIVYRKEVEELFINPMKIDLSGQMNGWYILVMKLADGRRYSERVVLMGGY